MITDLNTTDLKSDLALNYLVQPAKTTDNNHRILILLHGVGSNEQDLFALARLVPDNYTVIAPRGPFILGANRYAWYQVDFTTGKPALNEAQEAESRQLISRFIDEVKTKYNTHEVYLGGFSQGAIMSYTIGLTQPGKVAGILSFSGRILTEIRPLVQAGPELNNLAVFIAHGTQDGTLPVHYAREARTYLQALGIEPAYHELEMGHQLNDQVLTEIQNWLK
ncbi:esterase [Pontibacter sp. H259]|uniref:alpha/beta hydrolase n=1 Tax=Pontibacter sp. H259 TaxID=3133421 RepID=UPI0030BE7A50